MLRYFLEKAKPSSVNIDSIQYYNIKSNFQFMLHYSVHGLCTAMLDWYEGRVEDVRKNNIVMLTFSVLSATSLMGMLDSELDKFSIR